MLDTTKENMSTLDEESFINDLIDHCKLVTIFFKVVLYSPKGYENNLGE